VSDHGEVLAADSGRARAEEHRWGVRKLVGGSVRAEGGRRRELHGELGGGGGHGARRLLRRARKARPGSRRSGAGAERSEAAWGARNRSRWRGKAGATPVAAL